MTVILLPLLFVVLAGVLELGALRVTAYRAASAADVATLVAVNDQDQLALARTGALRPTADASDVARSYFAANLAPYAASFAATAESIAGSARIAVFADPPQIDPETGMRYHRPTVRLVAAVPIRTPMFGALLRMPVTTVTVRSASSTR